MVVEGSEVKNRSTMCVPSAEKEQLNPQVSLRNDNKILHVQLIHWQMLQKFCPKTCHTILSLLSNKYKEKPQNLYYTSRDLREISLVMAISSWSVTISANLSLNSFDHVSASFKELKGFFKHHPQVYTYDNKDFGKTRDYLIVHDCIQYMYTIYHSSNSVFTTKLQKLFFKNFITIIIITIRTTSSSNL